MTRAPLAPEEIRGLINLRGQIVVALDLRRRLGLPEREEGALPMNVVVRSDDASISLLVDEIGDVLEVDEELFEPPPETLQAGREFVRGAYKLDGRLLLELDMDRVVEITTG
jgi:purine-binding chemotaxis protein CheW